MGFKCAFAGRGGAKEETTQPRVEWHELKLGVFYRHEEAVGSERGQLLEKVMVGWQGEGLELGRRLHWEAMRGGLGRAATCWRWLTALRGFGTWWGIGGARRINCLDFYHASQHLWTLGEALYPKAETARRSWVEDRLHRLRHGQEQAVLREMVGLAAATGPEGQSDWAGTKLLRWARRTNELPSSGQTRMADCQRRGGVRLSSSPMPAQAPRTVLDTLRPAPSWMRSKKLVTMAIGMNSGSRSNGAGAKLRPRLF